MGFNDAPGANKSNKEKVQEEDTSYVDMAEGRFTGETVVEDKWGRNKWEIERDGLLKKRKPEEYVRAEAWLGRDEKGNIHKTEIVNSFLVSIIWKSDDGQIRYELFVGSENEEEDTGAAWCAPRFYDQKQARAALEFVEDAVTKTKNIELIRSSLSNLAEVFRNFDNEIHNEETREQVANEEKNRNVG